MSDDSKKQMVAVISRYDVPSDKQPDLATALHKELERWICKRPGFVSGTVHSSIDQLHIIFYTIWHREEDGLNYFQCPEAREFWEILAHSGARTRDSHTYWIGEAVVPEQGV